MFGSAIAFAHNGVEHVMGTVIAVTDNSITVDTTQLKSVTVMVEAATTFTNKNAKASPKDLKVGAKLKYEDARRSQNVKSRRVISGTKVPALSRKLFVSFGLRVRSTFFDPGYGKIEIRYDSYRFTLFIRHDRLIGPDANYSSRTRRSSPRAGFVRNDQYLHGADRVHPL
jgi:hypothetical protein